jgi:dipeptidyl aminopeptidase/acylaminoacyl peptidase
LVGASAGAHLALLYGYSVDKSEQVNVIANIVGPTGLTDPSYGKFEVTNSLIQNLVGNYTAANNPQLYATVCPVTYITRESSKTISFYGALDNLVPVSQGQILEDRLDTAGVFNKYYLYPDEGHGFVKSTTMDHLFKKTLAFFKNYL